MDQRRLESIGQRTQFLGCIMTSSTAHDGDVASFVDAASHLGKICFTSGYFASRLERGNTRSAAVGRRANDILWQRQMCDATATIGGGDGLMDNSRRLCS